MIDDAARELLSRHLDGDLDAGETLEVEARLQRDEALRLELVGLERVRAALQQLGASEQPPAALDRIVEPLVLGPPPVTGPRPWVRWLASAAVVVLGLTVLLEVSEHRSRPATGDWPARARERSATETADRFALAPLPTRPPAADASPRGAADRLLAADDPEIETAGEVPPPLEVLGPLEEPLQEGRNDDEAKAGRRRIVGSGAVAPQAAVDDGPGGSHGTNPGAPPSPAAKAAPNTEKRSPIGPRDTTGGKGQPAAMAGVDGQLMVFVDGETAWRSFELEVRCDPGRYAVRVRIEGGVVRKVWPVWKPLAAPSESLMASQLVLGLEIEGVGDGEYPGEVVVEARRPPLR